MSLLKEDALKLDDASAHGEDLAKGSGQVWISAAIAFVVLCVMLGVLWAVVHTPPMAVGEIQRVVVHPVHRINQRTDASGVVLAPEQFDQVLVFATVHVRNQSREPLVVEEINTNVNFADGVHTSRAVTPYDYDRIFIAYPELKSLRDKVLLADTVLAPGQSMDGQVVASFRVTKPDWDARKEMNITLNLRMHPSLVLTVAPGTLTTE